MSGGSEFRGKVRETREAIHSLFGTGPAAQPRAELPELRSLPVTEPGFYDMTADEYHRDPCPEPSLSASFACELLDTTPKHARLKHPRLTPQPVEDEAEHFNIGTVAHAILLEGRDVVQILEHDDFRTKAARETRDASRAKGRVPLLRKTWHDVERMLGETRAQLEAHEDGAAMFRDGLAEPVLVWREDGLWFRSRLDWLRVTSSRRFAIDDYKTVSTCAGPEALSERRFFDHGWHIKASFYRRGLHALTGFPAEFRFAVQETYAPFALSVIAPGPSAEMHGDAEVERAIERWRRGLRDNDWPGYPRRTAYVDVPMWLDKRIAEREMRNAV